MAISYTQHEELANSLTHGIGVVIGLAASAVFLYISYMRYDALACLGVWLYAFGVTSSYLSSTLYHGSRQGSRHREILRKLDHSAIYWHIAGSYSPITLIGLQDNMLWGWILFITVWGCALIGSIMSFRGLKEHSNLETICFVGMGMVVLLAFKPVLIAIGWTSMGWIIAEGVAFVTGAAFYSMNKLRYMHTVFHLFVLLGSVCHIMAIWYMFYNFSTNL